MDTDISLASTGILTKREYDEDQLVQSGDDTLDRNAFLALLTTQLQNQNPLDPMKNEAFVAQLAQFSQLEGITNMSTSLDDVAGVIKADRLMTGSNLVGKSIFGQTGRIDTDGATSASIEIDLPYGAENVELKIYAADSGALIRSISSGPQGSGVAKFAWDGRDADYDPVPPGSYVIRAKATIDGAENPIKPFTESKVESVSWNGQSGDLAVNLAGGASLPLDQVARISNPKNKFDTADTTESESDASEDPQMVDLADIISKYSIGE